LQPVFSGLKQSARLQLIFPDSEFLPGFDFKFMLNLFSASTNEND